MDMNYGILKGGNAKVFLSTIIDKQWICLVRSLYDAQNIPFPFQGQVSFEDDELLILKGQKTLVWQKGKCYYVEFSIKYRPIRWWCFWWQEYWEVTTTSKEVT